MTYKEKHTQMNREARGALIAGAVVMAFWWAAGFALSRLDFTIFHLPGWFVVGSFGTWVLSIGLVCILLKRVFKNFSLEDDKPEDAHGE
ncbi:MAG: YhdT family protein [Spirochaetaceae bacterium]|jgi:uncharacterized membrane protein YhdT|nr:YhdT family protein [Spirochaetaceae bacterium]